MSLQGIRPIETYFKVNSSKNSKKAQKECKSQAIICKTMQTPSPKNKNFSEESRTIIDLEIHENMKKKAIKQEDKQEKSTQISKLLFKGSLRTRFEKLDSIQTIQDMMEIPKYQQFLKLYFILNTILKKQPMTFQEIKIQFKQDYQIEFKVQNLQQMMTIWPEVFNLAWKYLENEKYLLEVGLDFKQINIFGDKYKIFQEKLLKYIQNNGEYIELHQLPEMIEDKIEFKNQETESQTNCFNYLNFFNQQKQPLKQIALELQTYYSLRKVSNMFLLNVEKYLLKLAYTRNQIRQFIEELAEKFPQWILILDGQSDKILRINRDINIKQLLLESDCLECN